MLLCISPYKKAKRGFVADGLARYECRKSVRGPAYWNIPLHYPHPPNKKPEVSSAYSDRLNRVNESGDGGTSSGEAEPNNWKGELLIPRTCLVGTQRRLASAVLHRVAGVHLEENGDV